MCIWRIPKRTKLKSLFLWEGSYEPSLFVLHKLILQKRMCSHPVRLGVWYLVRPFVYFHTSWVWTALALVRLCGCTGSPEPSLVAWGFACCLCVCVCVFGFNVAFNKFSVISWRCLVAGCLCDKYHNLMSWLIWHLSKLTFIINYNLKWNDSQMRWIFTKEILNQSNLFLLFSFFFSPPIIKLFSLNQRQLVLQLSTNEMSVLHQSELV